MKKLILGCGLFIGILMIAGIVLFRSGEKLSPAGILSVASLLSNTDTVGYAHATTLRNFMFPDDHGPHPDFKTEWWYFTGNLVTKQGRRFGFQLTFFRSAQSPVSPVRASDLATNQIYMAHFALSDIQSGVFHSFERFSRGAGGLAGVQTNPFRVWTESWSAMSMGNSFLPLRLHAVQDGISIDLQLDSTKPLVLQGDKGLSRKGSGEGNASYYYSSTRMKAHGTVQLSQEQDTIDGLVWMDREWSTSALEKDQTGWDWFSLQLSDGRELMYYQLRKRDGTVDDFSAGTLIEKDGLTKKIEGKDVLLDVLDHWTSPHSQAVYPSAWRLRIPGERIDLMLKPYLHDQELQVSVRYWEGAVSAKGKANGTPIQGSGYIEMTGYGERKEGR